MKDVRVKAAVAIYAVLGATGWGLCAAYGWSPWHSRRAATASGVATSVVWAVAGVACGLLVVALSQGLVRRWAWASALTRELRHGLAGLDARAAAPLALSSALGEELFFRGFAQNAIVAWIGVVPGVLAAALIFAVAHVPWNRRLLGWTAMAGLVGLLFGAVYAWTGELIFAVCAHAVVNHANLRFILRFEARDDSPLVQRTDSRAAAGT